MTSSNHVRSVNFTALLFGSPFALMKTCCYLAENSGVVFKVLKQLSKESSLSEILETLFAIFNYMKIQMYLEQECQTHLVLCAIITSLRFMRARQFCT